MFELLKTRLLYGPCQKLYKKEIIQRYKIKFPIGVNYAEDRLFNAAYLSYTSQITSIKSVAYHYRMHSADTLSQRFYPNLWEMEYLSWKAFYNLLFSGINFTTNIKEQLYEDLFWLIADNIFSAEQMTYRPSVKARKKYIEQILSIEELKNLNYVQKKISISRLVFYSIVNRYVLILLLYIYLIRRL